MSRIIRTEVRKRGFLGWVALLLFLGFNGFMAWGFVAGMNNAAKITANGEAEKAGQAIGMFMGAGMILFVWALGAVVLGLFVLIARGRKTVIEETVD